MSGAHPVSAYREQPLGFVDPDQRGIFIQHMDTALGLGDNDGRLVYCDFIVLLKDESMVGDHLPVDRDALPLEPLLEGFEAPFGELFFEKEQERGLGLGA
jgi:hypothetical protein